MKIVLIGEMNVGKSSLTRRITEDRFIDEQSTIGFNYQPTTFELDGFDLKLGKCSKVDASS